MQTFVSFKNRFWMWASFALLLVLTALYIIDSPLGGRSGDTWLGWSYGFLAAAGIIYLMWFGVRKRSYYSTLGTVQGWLSAHVWIGVSLIVIVPLHSAFSFGWNVHTLAYVLMTVVIFSGIYGAYCYINLAPQLRIHRGGGSFEQLLKSLAEVDKELDKVCADTNSSLGKLRNEVDFKFEPSVWSCRRSDLIPEPQRSREAELMSKLTGQEQEQALGILNLVTKKRQLAKQLQGDVNALSRMQLWLYVHLPVSFALLAALAVHVFVVFWYR